VHENTYTITVWTSDLHGAGTDANVFCVLYGDKGETGNMKLDNPKNKCAGSGYTVSGSNLFLT
jgi:hypothetical protein